MGQISIWSRTYEFNHHYYSITQIKRKSRIILIGAYYLLRCDNHRPNPVYSWLHYDNNNLLSDLFLQWFFQFSCLFVSELSKQLSTPLSELNRHFMSPNILNNLILSSLCFSDLSISPEYFFWTFSPSCSRSALIFSKCSYFLCFCFFFL